MGACSALTHTVLGQLKSVVIILGGWLIFGQAYPPKALCGALLALLAIVGYTRANLDEHKAAVRDARIGAIGLALGKPPKGQTTPPAAPEKEGLLEPK